MDKLSPTFHARSLYKVLRERGVNAVMEYFDGHKCVDIGIPESYIYIEVDGENHITDPSQIERDFLRDHYSGKEGFATMHIANQAIENHLNEIAEAIAIVADKRKELIKDAILP